MKQRRRIYYTEGINMGTLAQRWGAASDCPTVRSGSLRHGILEETGGIQPAPRLRSRLALTLAEREEVSRSLIAGLPSRLLAGSSMHMRSTRTTRCRTSPSNVAFTSRLAVRPRRNCWNTCDVLESCGVPALTQRRLTTAGESATSYRLANALPRPRIARYPVTMRVTCCVEAVVARW